MNTDIPKEESSYWGGKAEMAAEKFEEYKAMQEAFAEASQDAVAAPGGPDWEASDEALRRRSDLVGNADEELEFLFSRDFLRHRGRIAALQGIENDRAYREAFEKWAFDAAARFIACRSGELIIARRQELFSRMMLEHIDDQTAYLEAVVAHYSEEDPARIREQARAHWELREGQAHHAKRTIPKSFEPDL